MSASIVARMAAALSVVLLSLSVVLNGPIASAAPGDQKPYFKVFGGDVMVGGAFNTTVSTDCTSFGNYYQSNATTAGAGGIYAYAKDNGVNSAGGASGDYGVFALGPIEGNSGNNYGFYSAGALASGPGNTKKNLLTFADSAPGGAWGGNFDGSSPNLTNCIPDYYDMKISNASGSWPGIGGADGTYALSGGSPFVYNLAGGTVSGKQTLLVNGSVVITSDISYTPSATESNTPKFELIAKGNIYIAPNVHRLDGLYVAQPTTTSSTDGVIWTCHDPTDLTNNVSIWFNQNCTSKLVINGAVAARQIDLMREQGDVQTANKNETAGNANIAEEINYIPAMVIGGPFEGESNSSAYKINSILNLPPVF